MMRCRKVKRRLSSYLDKELAEREIPSIEGHLTKCSKCQEELNLLLGVSKALKADEGIDASPNFEVRFWRMVAGEESRRGLSLEVLLEVLLGWVRPIPLFAQVAITILVGVSLGIGTGHLFPFSSAKQEIINSLDLERFSNLQPDSISRTYISLTWRKD